MTQVLYLKAETIFETAFCSVCALTTLFLQACLRAFVFFL